MNTDALAPKWIFYYFQVFGLHSINDKRWPSCCFQIGLFITLFLFYFAGNYYYFIQIEKLNTLAVVSILEGTVSAKT